LTANFCVPRIVRVMTKKDKFVLPSKFKTISLAVTTLIASFQISAATGIDPSKEWKVFETENFRVHYMPEYRDWSIAATHEMEASRDAIIKHQKRTLPEKVDVVVFDPLNTSNGFALPFSTKPFMALYTTPPLSDSQISNSSSWAQLLALHEYVHLVHLAQPTRNEWKQKLRHLYDLYDVTSSMLDRWAAEGYATLLESKLTGRGRLYDVQVEMMLQQFAREGGWPTYGELSSTEGRYRLGNMAYLIGARYLAWLEENYSEQTLDAVWTRMQAVKGRSFDEAFRGVFNQSPALLYQRFVAEFTQKVMNSENPEALAKSKLWLDGAFELAAPALSPDQSMLAIVEKSPRSQQKVSLKVYSTADNVKAKEEFEKSNKELLEADPKDIVDNAPEVFKREVKHTLVQTNFSNIANPRWFGDDAIVFGANAVDGDGFLHQDLYMWSLKSGKVQRLTTELNLRRFDVSKETRTIFAEQNRFGRSSIVKLTFDEDFALSGSEELLTPSLDEGYDFIRLNPTDQNQMLYMQRASNQPWQVVIRNLNTGSEQLVPMPYQYQFLSFANWSNDGKSVYFVAGKGEALNLYRFNTESDELHVITEGYTPVAWPMELSQGDEQALLYLSYRSTGPNVYSREFAPETWAKVDKLADQTDYGYLNDISDSAVKMPPASYNLDDSIGKEYDYNSSQGIGRQEITLTLSGALSSASTGLNEIGVKGSDLLQRVNWRINAGMDFDGSHSGFSAAAQYHGLPVSIGFDVHNYELDHGEQNWSIAGLNTEYAGFGADIFKKYRFAQVSGYQGKIAAGYDFNEWKPQGFAVEQTESFYLNHEQSWMLDRQSWGIYQFSKLSYFDGEYDAEVDGLGQAYTGYNISAGFGGHYMGLALYGQYHGYKRDDIDRRLLSAGGIQSTIVHSGSEPNLVFMPELPFGYVRSNDIEVVSISAGKRNSSLQFYYTELISDGFTRADIYGIKDSFELNFVRAGLTNFHVSYGAAVVEDALEEYHGQAWLSLRYRY